MVSTTLAPATQRYLGLPGTVIQIAMLLAALVALVFILQRRMVLVRAANPDPRLDRIGTRLRRLLVFGLGQARQPRYPVAGILHILIFAGFLILSLRSLTLLGEGIWEGFALPFFHGALGRCYATLEDLTELVVLICCAVAALRRLVARPARYHDRHARRSHAGEAYLILGMIALLMVADALHRGSALGPGAPAQPFAALVAAGLGGLDADLRTALHLASFWIHNATLLFFLCYLPLSKHFHVLSALPNIFLLNLAPAGKIKPPRHGVEDLYSLESLGVGELEEFTWKHILDFYSCTDCGRCTANCPAYASGTPLSPRMITVKCRDLAYASHPILGPAQPREKRPKLVGEVVREEELWACTTCGACEDACPLFIEYIDKIVDMRRFLVDEGRVPTALQKPLAALEKHGNPYGKMARKRAEWIGKKDDALDVPILAAGASTDILLFADSCAAYDPRIQQILRALAAVLISAGQKCATLGRDEVDSGHEARRIGEEGLFETLRERNLEALEARAFQRVVTGDPHAFNALRNDYALEQPVQHHSEVLAELIHAGRLHPRPLDDERVYTFHDPCYLGRHNGIYEAPRALLRALPGLKLIEMKRSRNRSSCCGGGSLYLFAEGECEERMGEQRLRMAAEAGAQVVVTACPFCLLNLEDAVKTTGLEGRIEVLDLVEVLARSLGAATNSQQGAI